MPSLKTLRMRIRSVRSTRQITKAMKMVAAAKLRRSQERAQATRPYSKRMGAMIQSLASRVEATPDSHPLLAGHGGNAKRVELLVCTSDRGLCGSFNSGVVRSVRAKVQAMRQEGMQVTLSCVGRKGYDVLRRQFEVRNRYQDVSRRLSFPMVEKEIASDLLTAYEENKFDVCILVYNTFKSAMSQVLTWKQIIPAPVDAEQKPDGGNYLYEPSEEELLGDLLTRNVAVQVFQALVESDASENGARMTAMDNAVRNAGDMINRLTITFNRTRQAAITKELMEIIGGAESLKG